MIGQTAYQKYTKCRPFRVDKKVAENIVTKCNGEYRLMEDRVYVRIIYKKHLLPWPWKDYYYLQFVNTNNPFMDQKYPSLYSYPQTLLAKVI